MQFNKWLEFSYYHDYFDNPATPRLLSIIPLAQTQALFADLAMQFKPTANGFFIYGPANDNDEQKVAKALSPNDIRFAIYANDPYFVNFTDMPYIEPGEQVFYLAVDNQTTIDVGLTEKRLYPLQQKGLLVNKNHFSVTSQDQVLNKQSDRGGKDNPLFPDPNSYYLNMTNWPDGLYKVIGGDDTKQANFNGDKVFVSRELIAKPPLAILQAALFIQNQPAQTKSVPTITLSLESRKVFWRYQITNGQQENNLSIDVKAAKFTGSSNGEAMPEFELIEQTSQSGLTEFISTKTIPLTQAPWLNVELTSTDTTLLKNLANPQVTAVYTFQENETLSGIEVSKDDFYAMIRVTGYAS